MNIELVVQASKVTEKKKLVYNPINCSLHLH